LQLLHPRLHRSLIVRLCDCPEIVLGHGYQLQACAWLLLRSRGRDLVHQLLQLLAQLWRARAVWAPPSLWRRL